MDTPLRILLVDDHVMFRRGLAALIGVRDDLVVAGEARDGLEAVQQARLCTPDVVLMDIHMPRCNGVEAITLIKQECPHVRIVMLTVSSEDRDLFDAIRQGADGYLLKDLEPQQLFDLLEGIRRDEMPLAPTLTGRLMTELRDRRRAEEETAQNQRAVLTGREVEVLRLVALGATNRDIAGVLSISENTVKTHLRSLLDKLHVRNRTEVTAYALQHGLVDNPAQGA